MDAGEVGRLSTQSKGAERLECRSLCLLDDALASERGSEWNLRLCSSQGGGTCLWSSALQTPCPPWAQLFWESKRTGKEQPWPRWGSHHEAGRGPQGQWVPLDIDLRGRRSPAGPLQLGLSHHLFYSEAFSGQVSLSTIFMGSLSQGGRLD